jgi:hypothetical protein
MMTILMDERDAHRQFEEHFLQQLRARALALTQGSFKADDVRSEATLEGSEALRAELSRLGVFDRDALERLPGSASVELHFTRKALGGLFRNTVARVRTRVLAPVAELVRGQPGRPVGREEVLDALARYQVLPRGKRPTGVVFACASGFTDEARRLVESQPAEMSLVLVGGRADGGFDVALPGRLKGSPWAKLFELESQDARLARLRLHLEQNATLLDSRGVSLPELAGKLGLPAVEVEALVRQACRTDPRLMTVTQDGRTLLCRTPLGMEAATMKSTASLWSRMRRMLGFKPTVPEQVRTLTAQRVQLEQQRHEFDGKVNTLEAEERELLARGAAARTDAEKKQLAGKLIRARRELSRLRSQATLFTNQIDVIGTQIHHLTVAEQGRRIALPSAEELTAQAAEAERVMAEQSANAELARQIEVTGETPAMADEEEAIFAEFAQAAGETAATKSAAGPAASPASAASGSGDRMRTPESPSRSPASALRSPAEPPPLPASDDKTRAKPELS